MKTQKRLLLMAIGILVVILIYFDLSATILAAL